MKKLRNAPRNLIDILFLKKGAKNNPEQHSQSQQETFIPVLSLLRRVRTEQKKDSQPQEESAIPVPPLLRLAIPVPPLLRGVRGDRHFKNKKSKSNRTKALIGISSIFVWTTPTLAFPTHFPEAQHSLTTPQAIAQNPTSQGNSCAEITNPLTPEEETFARVAWQYFLNNYQEATGFTNSTHNYPSGTLWDMGNYLMALNAARWLNLINQDEFDSKLNKFLSSLSGLKLFEDSLPNKVYNAATGDMVDYGNQVIERGIGWSALDIGRILAAFHVLRTCHPQYSDWLKSIIDRWALERSVKDGMMYGATVLPDGQTLPVQEGRLGYEEYAARGYELWGYSLPKAVSYEPFKLVEIYGVKVPVDTRNYQDTNANNYVVSESYILDAIEFGFLGEQTKQYAADVLEVQRRRYLAIGQLTAVTEDNIDGPPYFLYNTVFSNGNAWATITETNELYPQLRSISTKAALGWRYVYPDNPYAQQLFEIAKTMMSPDGGGFFAGQYEETKEPNKALTGNTNGLIMEILYYKARGYKPMIGGEGVTPSSGTPEETIVLQDYPPPPNTQVATATPTPAQTNPPPVSTQPAPVSSQPPAVEPAPTPSSPPTPIPTPTPRPIPLTAAIEPNASPCPSSNHTSSEPIAVAPIPPLSGSSKPVCPKLSKPLSIPERRYAKAAWAYFTANYYEPTGLVSDRSDLDGVTVWGMGDYLAATHAAFSLNVISMEEFDDRVRRFLGALARLPLFEGSLPHRGYHLKTLQPVDYGSNTLGSGQGWSSIDIGRLMLALYQLKSCHPLYRDIIDNILLQWSYLRVVRNGQLYDAFLETDEFGRRLTRVRPVTQIGYEEYAARGFQLWGFDMNLSAVTGHYDTVTVDGIEVPIRRRHSSIPTDASQTSRNYLVSDPFVRYGLELGFDPLMQRLVDPIVAVQAARYSKDGILTASATNRVELSPYILHSTIVGNDRPWVNLQDDGTPSQHNRIVSSAVAFGINAIMPNNDYGKILQQSVTDLYNPSLGYYEGFNEKTGDLSVGFSNSTNSLVLQSLLYNHSQQKPLLTVNVDLKSPWWQAIKQGYSGNGLPETATPKIQLVANGNRPYWVSMEQVPAHIASHTTQTRSIESNVDLNSAWWKAIEQGYSDNGLPKTATQKVGLIADGNPPYWVSMEQVPANVGNPVVQQMREDSLQATNKEPVPRSGRILDRLPEPETEPLENSHTTQTRSIESISVSPRDLTAAKQAWQYFEKNWNPETGMVSAVDNFPWTTLWDQGSAILGIHAAYQMGVIDGDRFHSIMGRLLQTLESLPLSSMGLPNKAYETKTATMRTLDNRPDPQGKTGWSVLDLARCLSGLRVLYVHYPQYEERIERIVTRWDSIKLVQDGWLYGGIYDGDGKVKRLQEGRLGYEQYAAHALKLWGIEANNALKNPPVKKVDIDGIPLQVDKRNLKNSGASNYLTSDPYLFWGLELGFPPAVKPQVESLFQLQKQRFKQTGILTAVNEDSLDRAPHFLYYSVYANGKPWSAISSRGKTFPEMKFLSSKAAFGWSALMPEDPYGATLREAVQELAEPEKGYLAGRYESSQLGNNAVFNLNTNGAILESLLYVARGGIPLI